MKLKIYIVCLAVMSVLTSCEGYLDRNIKTNMDKDFAFKTYQNARQVAYSMYASLPQGLNCASGAMMASATDEAEFAVQSHSVQKFNLGSWNPSNMPENPFNSYYQAIRKGYDFLENADNIDFSDVKDNPEKPGVYENYLEDIKYLKEEVKLLRAYYIFELVKRYGGVPLIDRKMELQDDYSDIRRASLQECVEEIVRTCDDVELPVRHTEDRHGRLTKGAALAIKSEVLLFAASDLWNNPSWAGNYEHPELISLPEADRKERWKAAADAAKAVIDLKVEAGYELDGEYSNLFGKNAYNSVEMIFARRDGNSNFFEKTNYPISFYTSVTGGNCPTENLVGMFQMKDGSDFNWNDPVMAANPYADRDPRLEKSVVTNNTRMNGRIVECWTGGMDGAGVRNATPTGYYIKKFVNPEINLNNNQSSVHTWIIIRLGEIYLNYIEALNEYDPGNADIGIYYNLIRNRAGMPDMPENLDQDQVRELIRRERAVELCFEGQRYWDLRRWMDEKALKEPIRRVEITKDGDTFTYEPKELETRPFDSKTYFYPIPQGEMNKMPHWSQNPLWN